MATIHTFNTASDVRAELDNARKALAGVAHTGHYGYLNAVVTEIAELQGALDVLEGLEDLDHTTTVDKVEYLTSLLARGAEDTSSGRDGDVQRAHFSGVRATASRKLRALFRKLDDELDASEVNR